MIRLQLIQIFTTYYKNPQKKYYYLFLCIIALNAMPSRQEDVKSDTRTPGYFDVDLRAHFNKASRADTFGSSPTTMSDI